MKAWRLGFTWEGALCILYSVEVDLNCMGTSQENPQSIQSIRISAAQAHVLLSEAADATINKFNNIFFLFLVSIGRF